MTRFADLPALVLGPLAGRPDRDWYQAPPGKWNPAQIVEHLALGIEWSGKGFEDRRARDPMTRRPRSLRERVSKLVLMGLGFFPPGRKAPSASVPADHVDRAAAEARFREGVARFRSLEGLLLPARAHDLYVKHPRLGDLTLEEWEAFHVLHARHHAKQIRARLAR
ncbi:MAG TPA: DUF1569 domain-containing protein [Gemmatimonadales bacterium]|nr:DUF1569 domain-containing protein [Gemmatimonadales bacterium]